MRIEGIRALSGPNVYHSKPVTVMTLRLDGLTERESREFPGFNARLLELLPGLATHHCSKGREGGFVERLDEGTYFGHVVEHVALELAGQLGNQGTYGKTRYAGEAGLYHVIVRHDNEAGMRYLLEASVELVDALVEGRGFDLRGTLERAARVIEETDPGPSTRAIIEAAQRRGIPWRRLTDGSLVELGQGRNLRRIQAAVTAATSQIAVDAAGDKALAKKLLADAFLPVPHGRVVTDVEEAVELLGELPVPLVVKPVYGNQGRAVSLDVRDPASMREAFREAAAVSAEVLVEEQVAGRDYRVLVVGGEVVAASQRVPCHVVGDGVHTIGELVDIANRDSRRGTGHSRPLTRIEGTDFRDMDQSRVPEAGEFVALRRAANLSQGGTAIDVTDAVHPETRTACIRAARVIGLDVCGLDVVTSDISEPLDGAIIEVNASPGLRMHLHPHEGEPRAVGEAIVEMLYPQGAPARIPVCSVTGTNGKTTVTRLIAFVLARAGQRVGATTTEGILIGGELVAKGDMTGPASARVVLSDPSIDAAVLECARGGILRRGLGFDWADTGVITNIRLDHVGQDGIEDLEDLIWIKSLVVERVRSGGTVVLNADDDAAAGLAESVKPGRNVVLYSVTDDNPRVLRHLAAGGTACFARNGVLVESGPEGETHVASVSQIPLTLGGASSYQVSNCLAALAACRAQGVPHDLICAALLAFSSNEHNPGRANLWHLGQGSVMLDYGHNPDAFRQAAELSSGWSGPVIAIAGVPGDRADSVIREAAEALASGFGRLWIKEDKDLRGRKQGEVAELIWRTVREHNPGVDCRIVLDELEALESVLDEVAAGANAIVFFEHREPVIKALTAAGGRPADALPSGSAEPSPGSGAAWRTGPAA